MLSNPGSIPASTPIPRRVGPPLPIELVYKIMNILNEEQQYASLARMGQANSRFYESAIPKLYETITIGLPNMQAIGFGYSNGIVGWQSAIESQQYVYSRTPVGSSSAVSPGATNFHTQRHPAEEYCLRLIIDVPLDNIADSLDRVHGTLSSRFLNLEEIVYTTAALTDRRLANLGPKTEGRPNHSPAIKSNACAVQSTEKTKRIILHLRPSRLCSVAGILDDLSGWYQSRPTARESTQLILYGLNFSRPTYNLYCMDVECHFDQSGIPPGAFEHALAQWLYQLYSKGDSSTHPRLRLFDIPSLVFKEEDRPSGSIEANQAARELLETLLSSNKRFGGKAKYLKDVMSKIDFFDSAYVDQEYPTAKPKPVSY